MRFIALYLVAYHTYCNLSNEKRAIRV